MSNNTPIMPKATAVWLVENTSLTFEQIAEFCHMHTLEIKGIADGDVASSIRGVDPITSGQLTLEEIERCTKDPSASLKLNMNKIHVLPSKKSKSRYTPIVRRQDKPDAILWLLKACPNIQDSHVVKLIGTTKNTIEAIKHKEHWNTKNLRPRDPVFLGLCTQSALDEILSKYTIEEKLSGDTQK
ncbi:MAG: cell cycle transcriptional regulator TrcR [Rickettsiaceae bacterium]|nr:cell cycle transcriptional regulator TrcR [Rickettsiaceae bacterium]